MSTKTDTNDLLVLDTPDGGAAYDELGSGATSGYGAEGPDPEDFDLAENDLEADDLDNDDLDADIDDDLSDDLDDDE